MATVTITITDDPGNLMGVKIDFDPAIEKGTHKDDLTRAQITGLTLVEVFSEGEKHNGF